MIDRRVLSNGTPLQIAANADAKRAVIVLQEAFGVNDHIRDVTQRFADAGYFALAPELFHRSGSPEIAYDQFADAMESLGKLSAAGLSEDLRASAEFLREQGFPTESIGIVGYCMGGAVALFANTIGLVGASVTFYGGGVAKGRFGLDSLIDLAPQLKAPWLGLYGDLDQGIPVDDVELLRAAAQAAPFTTEIVRYPNADHGFHCDARPASFNAAAATDAARRAYEFFDQNLIDA